MPRHLLACGLAAAASAAPAAAAPPPLRRTPFGLVDPACVLHVPSGATVAELPGGAGALITHPNGTLDARPPCASPHAASYADYAQRRRGGGPAAAVGGSPSEGGAAPPAVWDGWPQHLWFGLAYASFTNPPLKGHILALNATWTVPDAPARRTGNASDPWGGYPPTLSTWLGVQGGAVLQPVLEWNGLVPDAYDFVS